MELVLIALLATSPADACKQRRGGCNATCEVAQEAKARFEAARKAKAPKEELERLAKEAQRAEDDDSACRGSLMGM